MSIGDKIRKYRKELGLTQEYVAGKLQTTPQTIYKYEKGLVENIPLSSIIELAKLFNVTPAELTGWYDEPMPFERDMQQEKLKRDTESLALNETEKRLILSYRSKPEFHNAIHQLLGIAEENTLAQPSGVSLQTPRLRVATPPPSPYHLYKDGKKKDK